MTHAAPELCLVPISPRKRAKSIKVLNCFIAFARQRKAEPDHPTPRRIADELTGIMRDYFRRHPDTPRNETEIALCQRAIAHAIADAFNLETTDAPL